MLRRYANIISGKFALPVYLVGSALTKEDPRDYDLRVKIPNKEFEKRYFCDSAEQWMLRFQSGLYDESNWLWAKDNVKITKRGWTFCRLNIDFQAYPACYWKKYEKERKLKLSHIKLL
jgi:hypothetical protein